MVKYSWHKSEVPADLEIKQVYGIAFSEDNRILLRIEDGDYKLTGGKPENEERFEDTLKREYKEELNTELYNIYYLGYLSVERNNNPPYAQVRMIAKIKSINQKNCDPDNGKTYGRKLVCPYNVKKYLKYSDVAGNMMLDDAIAAANENYDFSVSCTEEILI